MRSVASLLLEADGVRSDLPPGTLRESVRAAAEAVGREGRTRAERIGESDVLLEVIRPPRSLVIFGTGISSLIGTAYVGIAITPFDQIFPDDLAQHPIARVLFGDGWGLIRASNTEPVLVARYEARTPERLQEIRSMMEGWPEGEGIGAATTGH